MQEGVNSPRHHHQLVLHLRLRPHPPLRVGGASAADAPRPPCFGPQLLPLGRSLAALPRRSERQARLTGGDARPRLP